MSASVWGFMGAVLLSVAWLAPQVAHWLRVRRAQRHAGIWRPR